MKQVIQNFKTGDLYVDEIPEPAISKGMVLVQTRFSLISAGTERSTVKVGKASLLGKAKQRPDLVAQVLQNIKKEGLKATLEKVKTKLDSLKALGYSASGVVAASMDHNFYFKPGDRVACAGQDYASHAEVICVPQNLVAKVPDNVSDEEASFTTLGAIALQGVRQAEPRLGDKVAVIGLGLLGQLTCQLLNANGCAVFGIDISDNLVVLAKEMGADYALNRNDANLMNAVEHFTNGYGFDSVIITAAAASNDPIELSAEISRKKGKVIAVGAVKLDVPRDPHFYRKELDLRLSCSYGPGRYDVQYEENGVDYPYAYVRWTEQRNMEAFLQLIHQKKIALKPLITHVFDIAEAEKAYDIVTGKNAQPHMAILLKYLYAEKETAVSLQHINHTQPAGNSHSVSFIGAGSFAQSYLIPHVKGSNALLNSVVTSKGITAKNVAGKFGFKKEAASAEEIIADTHTDTVFIATPHNTHATYALKALQNNKNVFVEKPLAMNAEELEKIKSIIPDTRGRLMVGFNRRFSPLAVVLKEKFLGSTAPFVINYRINAGFIPKEHWTQNPEIGGGRIIGEVCHFIDLMQFFTDDVPVSVFAQCISGQSDRTKNDDNIVVNITFKNGSVGSIIYVANGDKALPKERVELFCGGASAVINDFKTGEWYQNNKLTKINLNGKGHKEEVVAFMKAIENGENSPLAFSSIYYTTLATFKILDSLYTGLPQQLS